MSLLQDFRSGWSLLSGDRNLTRLWLAQTTSGLGDWLTRMALIELVNFRWHASATQFAWLLAASAVPALTLSPLAGTMADRYPRRLIMATSDLLRMALVVGLVWAHGYYYVLATSVLVSIVSVFFSPANAALLPQIVERDRLVGVNSFFALTGNGMSLVGPALGSLIVSLVGPALGFTLDALTFLVSAGLVCSIRLEAQQEAAGKRARGFAVMLVEGVQYVAAEKGVRFAFSLMTLAMLAAGVVRVLNPLFVRDVLHLDIRLVGGLSTSMSAGMLLGSVLTGLLARRLQPPTIALIGMGGAGLSFLVFALGVPWELGLVSYFCFGCFNPPIFISISAHLQRVVHADRLGRVFGMLGAMNQSASLAGMACAGPLSAGVGVQPTLIGAALAFCSLGLMGRFLPGYIAMRAADAAVATAAETE